MKVSEEFRSIIAQSFIQVSTTAHYSKRYGTYSGGRQLGWRFTISKEKYEGQEELGRLEIYLNSRLRARTASLALCSFADALSQTSNTTAQSSAAVAVR